MGLHKPSLDKYVFILHINDQFQKRMILSKYFQIIRVDKWI